MEERHRNTLRKHRAALLKDLEPAKVASRLYSENIFSAEDKDEVTSKDTNFDKSEVLLDKLPRKGPRAFSVFCDILKELASHLEALLRPTEVQEDGRASEGVESAEQKLSHLKVADEEKLPAQNIGNAGDQADAKWFGSSPSGPSGKYLPPADVGDPYRMDANPRGIAVIINNKEFLYESGMEKYPRNGTDVDRDALKKVFKKLLFDVKVYNNARCFEMRAVLKELATRDHSRYSAVIVAILTHGEEGVIYGTDGTLKTSDLTSWFTGANLAGKPKLFFFQACQGHEYMDGIEVVDGTEVVDGPGSQPARVNVPAEADFMYAYSTVPGYYSWRNSQNGSWFIQSVVDVFEKYADRMDILRMMTRVNAGVSTYKSRTSDHYSDQKMQIPSIVSMLRKELYFFPDKVLEQN